MKDFCSDCVEFSLSGAEFADDFSIGEEILKSEDKKVAIFGGAGVSCGGYFYEKAVYLSKKVSEAGISIVTGGGRGIMEAANKGASSAGMGASYGVLASCINSEKKNDFVDEKHHKVFHTLSIRLLALISCCDAVVFFPGGYGTMEELLSLSIRLKLGIVKKKPVYLFDSKFWSGFLSWLSGPVLDEKLIQECDLDIFVVEDDVQKIVDGIVLHLETLSRNVAC